MVLRVAKYSRCMSLAQRTALGVRHRPFCTTAVLSPQIFSSSLPHWLLFSPTNLLQFSHSQPTKGDHPPGSSGQPTPGGSSQPGEEAFREGMRLVNRGETLKSFPPLEEAAAGYPPAHLILFRLYSGSLYSTNKDPSRAASHGTLAGASFDYFTSEMETKGTPESHLHLALCYGYGLGCTKDQTRAFQEYKIAADGGDPLAQFAIAGYYEDGLGGAPKDQDLALKFRAMSAANGFAVAQLSLGSQLESIDPQESLRLTQAAAAQGLPAAICILGLIAEESEDFKTALNHFLDAGQRGDHRSQIFAGLYLQNGQGCDPDPERAFKFYQQVATETDSHPSAHCNMAFCYWNGIGVPQDGTLPQFKCTLVAAPHPFPSAMLTIMLGAKAIEHYTIAAERGEQRAQCSLAMAYESGQQVEKDLKKAIYWYTLSAEQGYPIAQHNLGHCYSKGIGVEANPEEFFKWVKKAADQGAVRAMMGVALCYHYGHGVPKDDTLALKFYTLAAEHGDAEAASVVGMAHMDGSLNAEKDPVKAVKFFKIGADKNDHHGLFNLAQSYVTGGGGLEKDPKKAFGLMERSANLGHPDAQERLGMFYYTGLGVEKDFKKAFELVSKAAEKGCADAQCNLGIFYVQGVLVTKDTTKAKQWFQAAAKKGHARAQAALALLLKTNPEPPKTAKD